MSHPDRGAVFNVAFGRHDDKLSVSDASGLESRDVATAGDGVTATARATVSSPR